MKVYTVLQENITKYYRYVMLFSQILELGQSVNQRSYHPIKKDLTLCPPIRLHPSKNVHYLVSVYLTMRLLKIFLFSQSNPIPLASLNYFSSNDSQLVYEVGIFSCYSIILLLSNSSSGLRTSAILIRESSIMSLIQLKSSLHTSKRV